MFTPTTFRTSRSFGFSSVDAPTKPTTVSPNLFPSNPTAPTRMTAPTTSYIAYVQLPIGKTLDSYQLLFQQLRGVSSWEIDGSRAAYLLLEPWMTKERIRDLYRALRQSYGSYIRFGAAAQKTTARAAALHRSVPHCAIITPETTDAFLAKLPIRLLPGLGQRTTRFLEQQGVRTFDAFRGLPISTLKQWFGVSGIILQQFARGIDPRVVEPQFARSF